MAHVLFVGNGINRLALNADSWEKLVCDFSKINQIKIDDIPNKPFPLAFEEIFLKGIEVKWKNETEMKIKVCKFIKYSEGNEYHKKIMLLGIKHIITTNYDYNFEKSFGSNIENNSPRRENKYSLYRRNVCKNTRIHHIHGEVFTPNSLVLGYEHYIGYLQKMREYILTNKGKKNRRYSPFMNGDKIFEQTTEDYSWIDIFFSNTIHIIGLSLEFMEIDLWWLFSFRARCMKRNQSFSDVYFYYKDDEINNEIKLSVLNSFNIHTIPIKCKNYCELYDEVLSKFYNTVNII